MLLQIKDIVYLQQQIKNILYMLFPHEILSKNRRKYPLSPDARRQGAFCPGMSDRERYKTRHTVDGFFAHIKEHKCLIARFDELDTTFFSFFALACLNVFKVFC